MKKMSGGRLSHLERTSYAGSREQEMAREIRRCWIVEAALRRIIQRKTLAGT